MASQNKFLSFALWFLQNLRKPQTCKYNEIWDVKGPVTLGGLHKYLTITFFKVWVVMGLLYWLDPISMKLVPMWRCIMYLTISSFNNLFKFDFLPHIENSYSVTIIFIKVMLVINSNEDSLLKFANSPPNLLCKVIS